MIVASLIWAFAQSPSLPPPPPATGPLRRHEFVVRSRSLAYPEFMQPMVVEYRQCVYPNGRPPHRSPLSREEAMRMRLAECAAARTREVARSIEGLGSEPEAGRLSAERVTAIFASLDRDHLANARFMDRIVAGEMKLLDPAQPVDLPEDIDAQD